MSSLERTSGPSRSGAVFDLDFYGTSLSDEAILDLLRTRLRDVDTQISNVTRTLQEHSQRAQYLGEQAQRLNMLREYLGREPFMDVSNGNLRLDHRPTGAELRELESRLGLPVGSLGFGDHTSLRDVLSRISINGQSCAGIATRDQFQQRAESISEALRQCNSNNEQLMIKLQSAMQQRTQVVQMASNMLKASDEARDAIVGNIR